MRAETAKKENAESGMMVVETVISFTAFVMVVIAVIYLINIFMLHNRVQFAINSAAHEIASYSYLYTALGGSSVENTLEADGRPHTTPINDTANQVVDSLNKIEALSDSLSGTVQSIENAEWNIESVRRVKEQMDKLKDDADAAASSVQSSAAGLKNLFSNPKSMLIGMIYIGAYQFGYEVKSLIGRAAAEGLTKKYLEQEGMSADAYLRSYGVKDGYAGLDFDGTTLYCESETGAGRIIDIVVNYEVDLKFLGYILPEPEISVVQRTSVAGWVDGDGVKPSKYNITKK